MTDWRHSESSTDAQSEKPEPMEPKDVFKFVLDTRNFEITNFWQRSNYFLVLNTGLAVAFFNLKDNGVGYSPYIAGVGMFVSFLWGRVTLGSKFWQIHWERKLAQVENEYVASGVLPASLKLFNQPVPEVTAEVTQALRNERHTGVFAQVVDRLIAKKPSVTLAMIALSFLAFACWFALLVLNLPGKEVRPNPSLERTATGKPLGPPAGTVNLPASGPSAFPASAPQLKR
jgi:hypothetical protein